jgi:hypothetical protein
MRKTIKINKLLLRVAAEDGAQKAAAQEIVRQVQRQIPWATVYCDSIVINFAEMNIADPWLINGMPVEYTQEAL